MHSNSTASNKTTSPGELSSPDGGMVNSNSLPVVQSPMTSPTQRILPDIASEANPEIGGKIDRVGMANIELMARIRTSDDQVLMLPAIADAQVDLVDDATKGIHMSRLFLELQKTLDNGEVSPQLIRDLLSRMVKSHEAISQSAFVALEFKLPIKQMALKSELSGWRHYPIRIEASLEKGEFELRVGFRVTYSSTCPCSASLSRQLLAEKFESDFDSHRWLSISSILSWIEENGSLATPHSQRSHVDVTVKMNNDQNQLPIELLISEVETALNTPVQAAVKRPDEQEFARLNGSNLMFCEDAARRIRFALDDMAIVSGFHFEINHLESLHPHDAVSQISKGVERGVNFKS